VLHHNDRVILHIYIVITVRLEQDELEMVHSAKRGCLPDHPNYNAAATAIEKVYSIKKLAGLYSRRWFDSSHVCLERFGRRISDGRVHEGRGYDVLTSWLIRSGGLFWQLGLSSGSNKSSCQLWTQKLWRLMGSWLAFCHERISMQMQRSRMCLNG
jgi:hypothetical protein